MIDRMYMKLVYKGCNGENVEFVRLLELENNPASEINIRTVLDTWGKVLQNNESTQNAFIEALKRKGILSDQSQLFNGE